MADPVTWATIVSYAKTAATVLSTASAAANIYKGTKGVDKPGQQPLGKQKPTAPQTDETRSREAANRQRERQVADSGRASTILQEQSVLG